MSKTDSKTTNSLIKNENSRKKKIPDDTWHVPRQTWKRSDQPKWKELGKAEKMKNCTKNLFVFGLLLVVILFFILSLSLLCQSFKLLGGKEVGQRIKTSKIIKNPVSASIVGMVVTLILQSSTTLMSILVGMVAARLLTVHQAIPVMMGSEMGASFMNALISLTQSGNRSQFRRAFAAATMNDIFNFLCFFILLPVEIVFAPVEKLSSLAVSPLSNVKTGKIKTLDALTDPLKELIIQLDHKKLHKAAISNDSMSSNESFVLRCLNQTPENCQFHHLFANSDYSDTTIGLILVAISIGSLVFCVITIVKILSVLLEGKIALILRKIMDKRLPYPFGWLTDYVFMLVGCIIVVIIESSSVFRSALTPLVGIGVVTLEQLFPLIIGGNIGTTSTSTLAAFSAAPEELQITLQMAFSQTIFNILGLLIFYPIPFMRKIPIKMAMKLGNKTAKYRWFALVYIAVIFFLMPSLLLGISLLPHTLMISILGFMTAVLTLIALISFLQRTFPNVLPEKLKSWECLPNWMHSLKPYDRFMSRIFGKVLRKGKRSQERRLISESEVPITGKIIKNAQEIKV